MGYAGADIGKPEQVAAMVATTEQEFGSLDVLVNNAGIQFTANIEDFPVDRWDSVIAINLSGVFHGMKAAIPGMKATRLGPDHQYRLGARAGRECAEGRLRRRQARRAGDDEGGGHRAGQ